MGKVWLLDLPRWIAEAGIDVGTWPGWENNSRSTGGFDAVWGILWHHTAGGPNQDTWASARQQFETGTDRPIANLTLGRDGLVIVGAAGASNHAGKGGPYPTSKGVIPLDQGNRYLLGIEMCNRGTGELWTPKQLEVARRLGAVLSMRLGLDPLRDNIAHYEWAPTRKIDPAGGTGQYPYARLNDQYLRWDMNRFRGDISQENLVALADKFESRDVRILDTRQPPLGNKAAAGQVVTISVPNPNGAVAATVNITATQPDAAGFLSTKPGTSKVNFTAGQTIANEGIVALDSQGRFNVYVGPAATHFVVDLVGVWYP